MIKKPLNIIFMGTPDFAVPALDNLIASPHNVIAVYSQPPRPKGRGQSVQPSPVQLRAERDNIPVFTPKSFKKDARAVEKFSNLNADVAIVAAYGLILPQSVLDAPQYGCLNIHGSILPRWRGAAPIQYAIWKGDTKTGITIMQMDKGLDTGPMISKKEVSIRPHTNAQSLHDILSALGSAEIEDVLDELSKTGHLKNTLQDDAQSTYASMLEKSDGEINWSQSAVEIDRQIRALNPWPSTYFKSSNKIFKVKSASLLDDKTEEPAGTLLNREGNIACGSETILRIDKIQPQGKKPMDMGSAINGGYFEIGEKFA